MVDYFDSAPALEAHLKEHEKFDLLEKVVEAGRRVNVITIRQPKALGLGHAILTAKPIVGNEPFAILLGDDIVFADKPVIGEMIKVFGSKSCGCHYGSSKRTYTTIRYLCGSMG